MPKHVDYELLAYRIRKKMDHNAIIKQIEKIRDEYAHHLRESRIASSYARAGKLPHWPVRDTMDFKWEEAYTYLYAIEYVLTLLESSRPQPGFPRPLHSQLKGD